MVGHRARWAFGVGVVLAVLVSVPPTDAEAKRRIPPCPGGVFWVDGEPLLTSGLAAPDAVAVEGGLVSLLSGCGPTTVKLKGTRRGTKLKAKWGSCPGISGRVRIKARIDPSCTTMAGKLRARKLKRSFSAHIRPPSGECGDGNLDPGEACDDGGNAPCDGCAADCSRRDGVCGDGIVECGEACDGAGTCGAGETCESCGCVGGLFCAEASTCGGRQYCSEARDCLCIRSAEGPILCGHIPSTCAVQLCQTSADCAGLGEGYFCDTPNSGCCSDGELPRCIAPCERPPCAQEQICGENCCPAGSGCAGGACCPTERICGATCCPEGEGCDGGTCARPGACPGDNVTDESLLAARAALEGGATEVALSPGGCTTYRRTLDGDTLTSDALVVAGKTASETSYTDTEASGRRDRNLDGVFDWEAVLTRGTDPEIAVVIRELDLESGQEVRREERAIRGDTVHVVVSQGGEIVNEFDTTVEQPDGFVATPAAEGTECDVSQQQRYLGALSRCMPRTSKCLRDHGREDIAKEMEQAAAKVHILCGTVGGKGYAQANAREAALGRKPTITVDTAKMDPTSEDFRASTMCHEVMHHTSLGLHDSGLTDTPREFDADQVKACEELCGFAFPNGPKPNKCQCASCLDTGDCDPRCAGYRDCDADMGALCLCPKRHIWYPSLTICRTECPSNLGCFGFSKCASLDRSCD